MQALDEYGRNFDGKLGTAAAGVAAGEAALSAATNFNSISSAQC